VPELGIPDDKEEISLALYEKFGNFAFLVNVTPFHTTLLPKSVLYLRTVSSVGISAYGIGCSENDETNTADLNKLLEKSKFPFFTILALSRIYEVCSPDERVGSIGIITK